MASGSVPTPPPLDPSAAAAGTPTGSAPVSAPTTPAPTLSDQERKKKITEIMDGLRAFEGIHRGIGGSEGLIGNQNRTKLYAFANEVLAKIGRVNNTTGSLTDATVTDEDIVKMQELCVASGIGKLEARRKNVLETRDAKMSLEEQAKERRKRTRDTPATAVDGNKFTVEGPKTKEFLQDIMGSKWVKLSEDLAPFLLIVLILAIKNLKYNPIPVDMRDISKSLAKGQGLHGDKNLKDVRMDVSRDGSTGRYTCSFSEVQRDAAGNVIKDAKGKEQTKPLETTDPRVQKIINNYCAKLGLDSPADGVPKPDVALSGSTPASDVSLASGNSGRGGVSLSPGPAAGTLSPSASPCAPAAGPDLTGSTPAGPSGGS